MRLVGNEAILLNITENIIKKCLFFKHEEEFAKELKDSNKESSFKKNAKQDKADKAKSHSKEENKGKEQAKGSETKPAEEAEMKEQDALDSSLVKVIFVI